MGTRILVVGTAIGAAMLLGGCAGQSNPFQTGSISATPAPQTVVAQPKMDPACPALAAQIESLRKEGVTERIEKASVGKTQTVKVKRESLVKMTELAKADAEFQARCSHPGARVAQVQPAAPQAAPANGAAPAAVAPVQTPAAPKP